jgi:NADH dehydrogenase
MANPIYQTVIVGGGFTGLFTALYLSHQHYPRSVILIERESRFRLSPYSTSIVLRDGYRGSLAIV